jgi:cytochrome c-type biogenesis protein CcmE
MQEAQRRSAAARRNKLLIGVTVILLTLAALVGWAMGRPGSTSFYMTTSELVAQGPTAAGETVRVNGKVVPGSLRQRGLRSAFALAEGGKAVRVVTSQPLPDSLKARSDVVAEGQFDGRRFTASQVLAKCPSKFKPRR